MTIKILSPQEAKTILEKSAKDKTRSNRKVSRDNVDKLKKHIAKNEWHAEINPGIFILKSGFVMNGQHTLHAISESSVSVAVNVVTNADETMMDFFDTGRGRNSADILTINNEGSASMKAAAAKVLYAYEKRDAKLLGKSPLTNHEVTEFYFKHKSMAKALYKAQELNKEPGLKASIALAFIYAADPHGKSPEVLEEWFRGLNKNVGLVENDPRTALIRKIRGKKQNKLKRTIRDEVIEYIKCWNAWVAGGEIKMLTVGAKEGIPTISPASNKVLVPVP